MSEGDDTAFESIYNFYQPRLYQYIYPFTKNSKEDTEEVLQNVFVKLWTRREALPAIRQFPEYLFRMARNQLFDLQKSIRRTALIIDDIPIIENEFRSPTYEHMVYQEYSAAAKQAIENLSDQRKRIFLMRFENDMSLDEIARILKIAKSSVKNQLYEAIMQIKRYLKKNGDMYILFLLSYLPEFYT